MRKSLIVIFAVIAGALLLSGCASARKSYESNPDLLQQNLDHRRVVFFPLPENSVTIQDTSSVCLDLIESIASLDQDFASLLSMSGQRLLIEHHSDIVVDSLAIQMFPPVDDTLFYRQVMESVYDASKEITFVTEPEDCYVEFPMYIPNPLKLDEIGIHPDIAVIVFNTEIYMEELTGIMPAVSVSSSTSSSTPETGLGISISKLPFMHFRTKYVVWDYSADDAILWGIKDKRCLYLGDISEEVWKTFFARHLIKILEPLDILDETFIEMYKEDDDDDY